MNRGDEKYRNSCLGKDRYSQTVQSWPLRVMGALTGIVAGGLLLIVAFPLLFWNEGQVVKQEKLLDCGERIVVPVAGEQVQADNEGRLVYLTGTPSSNEIVRDPVFKVHSKTISLARDVEMYQWQEKKEVKEVQGSDGKIVKETVCSYFRVWSSSLIDSSKFKEAAGHVNPDTMRYKTKYFTASDVKVGAFHLSARLVSRINTFVPLVPGNNAELPLVFGEKIHKEKNGYYLGNTPKQPETGDVRVSFRHVVPQNVSIVAGQYQETLGTYKMGDGRKIEELRVGTIRAEQFFQDARKSNPVFVWGLRVASLFLMFIGFKMIFHVFVVAGNVVPVLGNVAGAGTTCVSLLLGGVLAFTTTALVWIVYRPRVGGVLLAVAGFLACVVWLKLKKARLATN